jgi:hypothetical protein
MSSFRYLFQIELIVTFLFLVSCGGETSYEAVRSDCSISDGGYPLSYGENSVYYTVTEDCYAGISLLMNIDLDSFGVVPHSFDSAVTTDERLIAGLYVILADDDLTVEQISDIQYISDSFRSGVEDVIDVYDIGPTAGWSYLWYRHIDRWSDSISWSGSSDYSMGYQPNSKSIYVSDLTSLHPSRSDSAIPVEVASSLIHESSHGYLGEHIECASGSFSCDSNFDGAYGAQILWIYEWIRGHVDVLEEEDCFKASALIDGYCRAVYSVEEYPPCVVDSACY